MNGTELADALTTIGWSVRATEERFGFAEKTITRMVRDETAIPEWLQTRLAAIACVVQSLGVPPG